MNNTTNTNNTEEKNCPICPRECELTSPHCGRGEEYAKTGKLPEENGREHNHEHHEHDHEHHDHEHHEHDHECHEYDHEHDHEHHEHDHERHEYDHEHDHEHHEHDHEHHEHHERTPRLVFEKKEQQLVMKYLHHAVGAADLGGITQDQAGELFTVLTDEETQTLAGLLEKLSDHWTSLAPNKPSFHGRHCEKPEK